MVSSVLGGTAAIYYMERLQIPHLGVDAHNAPAIEIHFWNFLLDWHCNWFILPIEVFSNWELRISELKMWNLKSSPSTMHKCIFADEKLILWPPDFSQMRYIFNLNLPRGENSSWGFLNRLFESNIRLAGFHPQGFSVYLSGKKLTSTEEVQWAPFWGSRGLIFGSILASWHCGIRPQNETHI